MHPDKKKKKLKIMKILIKMTGGGGVSILCLMLNAEFLIISRVSRPVSAFSLRFFLWTGAPSNINSYANLRNMSGNIP